MLQKKAGEVWGVRMTRYYKRGMGWQDLIRLLGVGSKYFGPLSDTPVE